MVSTTAINGITVATRIDSGDGYARQEISFGRTTTTERSVGSGGDWIVKGVGTEWHGIKRDFYKSDRPEADGTAKVGRR